MAENKLTSTLSGETDTHTHTHTHTHTSRQVSRNYQLDFLKLIFSINVFFNHTVYFINDNTRYINPLTCSFLGYVAVWFFFVTSGMLMVESVSSKKPPVVETGKSALEFVVNKLKRLFIPLLSAELILVVINRLVMYNENVFSVFLKTIPDLTGINNSGILIAYNSPTWYISAMLIMMLPLCWLLIKHRDFFIYVFAPLFCVLSLGYMYNQENPLVNVNGFYGVVVGGILRAFSGLCAGVISWLICSKLRKITGRNHMIVLTIIEIIGWVSILFITITQFKKRDNQLVYIYMLMMIPLVAIVFSQKSYISRLFRFEFMKSLGRISLLIYLNHELAKRIVLFYFPSQSYGASVALMAAFTVAIIVAALLLEVLLIALIKKIKPVFLNGGFENDTKV